MAIERVTEGGALDYVSASRSSGRQLRALKEYGATLFPNSRKRVDECNQMRAGILESPIPSDIAKDIADSMKVRHAEAITTPLRLTNLLCADRPEIKRHASSYGRDAADNSTDIEISVNAALELPPPYGFPYQAWTDILLNEGEAGLIVMPRMAHWSDLGGRRTDERGPDHVIDFESYRASGQRRRYSPNPKTAGARAYRAHEDALLSEHAPFVMRAISPSNCYPFFGEAGNLIGLLVWSSYAAIELVRAGYVWESMKRHLAPTNSLGALGLGMMSEVEVIEWISTDLNGDPYVSYAVDGGKTANTQYADADAGRTATINLRETCGLSRLPAFYGWGQHWSTSDYDQRGIPWLWPNLGNLKAANALATGAVYSGWRNGFLSWALKRRPGQLPPGASLEMSQPKQIVIKPNTIVDLGDAEELIPLQHPGLADVPATLEYLMADVRTNSPGSASFGGDAASMADRALARTYLRDAVGHVVEAQQAGYKFAGEMVAEILYCVGKKYRPVPLAANTERPPRQGAKPSPTRSIVTLDPDAFGTPPVFDVSAVWPHVPGENLATAQQWLGFVEKGVMLEEEFRELAMGDDSPERFRARKVIQDFYNSPEGHADLLEYAAQKLADKKLAARFKMQTQGQLDQNGVPPGMLAGADRPQQPPMGMLGAPGAGGPGGGVPGVGMPDAAASQLGGIVAGPIQSGARMAAATAGPGAPGMAV